jgi:M6 family metalloprotease-like protein
MADGCQRSGLRPILRGGVRSTVLPALLSAFLLAPGGGEALAQTTSEPLLGRLTARWGDPPPDSGEPSILLFDLVDEKGNPTALAIDPDTLRRAGGIAAINGRLVEVRRHGSPSAWGPSAPADVTSLRVIEETGQSAGFAPEASLVSGSKPWISILCKFSDVPDEPESVEFFQGMYGSAPARLDHYWREVSSNRIDVLGSTAAGWFTLPKTRAEYLPGGSADLSALFADCTGAADPVVDFANGGGGFEGINLMFNDTLDCCAWGGARWATLDGVTKVWRVTWEPPWGWSDAAVIAHEMGHGFGLPHSNNWDGDGSPYDNPWDVMSAAQGYCVSDPVYGRLGKHTIAYHKDALGWIAAAEILTPGTAGIHSLTLDRLSIDTSPEYRMVRLPIEGSNRYYVVEAREQAGDYDGALPGNAVLVFEVDPGRQEPAWLVDGDNPPAGYASNPGSMWTPGEVFADPAAEIWISVDGVTANGFSISIGFRNPADLAVSPSALDFGEVVIGASAAANLTLSNLSSVFETADLSGVAASDPSFSLDATGGSAPCGTLTPSLGPGESCTLGIEFAPTEVGPLEATLTIDSNAAEPVLEVPLSGTGAEPPCPFEDHLLVTGYEAAQRIEEACLSITAGPLVIEAPAEVTLRAGQTVVLRNDFSIGSGARLVVELQ